MNKQLKIIGSKLVLNVSTLLFVFVYLVLIVLNFRRFGLNFLNSDFYKNHFLNYLENGHNNSVVEGTTIVYNIALKAIYSVIGNVEASFLTLNAISQLLILVFGVYFIYAIYNGRKDVYFKIVVGIYIFYILSSGYYIKAWNDVFLGVFILLLLYVLIVKIFKNNHQFYSFILVGILFSITLSIRPTAIVLLPLIVYILIFWFNKSESPVLQKAIKLFLSLFSFMLLTGVLHYPSLKENQVLSFYDKNPRLYHRHTDVSDLTWIQRNYLGLKKIEEGKEKLGRDAIWIKTTFEEVDRHLKQHGENSIPKTFSEFVVKDPILLGKLTVYNIVTSIVRFIRFWGFLFLLLLLPFLNFKKNKNNLSDIKQLPSILFALSIAIFSFVCTTFIEFRWFAGYEILIPIAILFQLDKISFFKKVYFKNMYFSASLIIITLFNFRTIFNLLDKI